VDLGSEHSGEQSSASVRGRIFCFPAHDEADEIAAGMLSQLLEHGGRATISFPLGFSPQSMVGVTEPAEDDIFCISAVPPFAFTHARALNEQIHARFPKAKVLVGVWGFNGERERAFQRFHPSRPDALVTSLAAALKYFGARAPAENMDIAK
jgi:hypothetical protein